MREDYFNKVEMLKNGISDIAITTDVMVGFPTEDEGDFNDTFDLMKKVGFSGAFIFIYSKREGTPAAKMDGQVDEKIATERIMKLLEFQNEFNRNQSLKYVGKTIEILCEGYDEKKGKYLGRDEYGRMAYFDGEKDDIGKFIDVKIISSGGISLFGEKV